MSVHELVLFKGGMAAFTIFEESNINDCYCITLQLRVE